ncbi:MAG: signal peptide peptidase SppA [Candidatus Aenigmatarchaeota archaeon]
MKKVWLIVVFGIFLFAISLFFGIPELEKAKVAKINIAGQINYGSYYTDPVSISENIERANEDPLTEAFLFTINSPGGSVVASKHVMQKIKSIEKPTVCKINDLGASGAYWIASACDHIVSDPLSMVGGIGVTGSYLEYSGLFDKYGIDYERLVSGKYKDTGTSYRNLTEREREKLMKKINEIHKAFMISVSENRGLNLSTVKNISDGTVYLGNKGKKIGLIDQLGGEDEVEDILKSELGREIRYEEFRKEVSVTDILSAKSENQKLIKNLLSTERIVKIPKVN